jgi:flagellar basal-body rod protein FlgF
MATSSFVSLSAQLALDSRLSTIANNIANARTVGFKSNGAAFSALTSATERFETAFASTGKNHVNLAAGGLTRTGNPLDVAVQGDAFLSYDGPAGTYYSRDGRLTLLETGEVVNALGHPLLDAGGAAIAINAAAGPPVVQPDGTLTQAGAQAAQIGLFRLDLSAGYGRAEGAGLVPTQAPEPVTSFGSDRIIQGYLEESNVEPVSEIVRLIQVTRAFEAASTLSDKVLDSELEAIRTLGAR